MPGSREFSRFWKRRRFHPRRVRPLDFHELTSRLSKRQKHLSSESKIATRQSTISTPLRLPSIAYGKTGGRSARRPRDTGGRVPLVPPHHAPDSTARRLPG